MSTQAKHERSAICVHEQQRFGCRKHGKPRVSFGRTGRSITSPPMSANLGLGNPDPDCAVSVPEFCWTRCAPIRARRRRRGFAGSCATNSSSACSPSRCNTHKLTVTQGQDECSRVDPGGPQKKAQRWIDGLNLGFRCRQ